VESKRITGVFYMPSPILGKMTQNIEKQKISQALEQNQWNQSVAARALGISLRQLRYKIEKLNLNRS